MVAADEGVKPQTREHFEICRLLQIPLGIIALTKIDAAAPNQTAAARRSITDLVKGSFLERAPVVAVSARTGHGLDALQNELLKLASSQPHRATERLFRLNIDRSFAAKGFGTVVTGTLLDGQLRTGETIQIHPHSRIAKVRGLQVHGQSVELAEAGERTAVNLAGIDHIDVQRGNVLTHRNELGPTSLIDASVEWLGQVQAPVKREQFLLHAGTAEIAVQLKVVGPARARIWLSSPTLVLPGDRFILRRPSPAGTIGGGTVLDAFPPARLNRAKINTRLAKLERDPWPQRIELLVDESANGRRLPELVKRTGLPSSLLRNYVSASDRLFLVETAQTVIGMNYLQANRRKLVEWLRDFHAKNPSAAGAPIAQARLNLEPSLAAAVFAGSSDVRIIGDIVALTTHKPTISPEQTKLLAAVEQAFRQAGSQPPAPAVLLQQAGTDASKGRPYLEALINQSATSDPGLRRDCFSCRRDFSHQAISKRSEGPEVFHT